MAAYDRFQPPGDGPNDVDDRLIDQAWDAAYEFYLDENPTLTLSRTKDAKEYADENWYTFMDDL
jgi:hypothetical protein